VAVAIETTVTVRHGGLGPPLARRREPRRPSIPTLGAVDSADPTPLIAK
jgi:hypothetical protein